jgi:YidC/Oxa1 family membrane protein insertase
MRGKSFLWADDLGAYDAIITWSQEIPIISSFYGNHVSGFAVMMAVSTFFYSRMSSANMPNTQQPGMPNMKVIMNLFPIITLVFFNRFAAGLNFYYFCANVISIVQMIVIKRYFIDEDKIRAKIDSNKATPKKKSSFQERLEEMQKVQQLQKKGKK